MERNLMFLVFIIFSFSKYSYSYPETGFAELLIQAEINPSGIITAREQAVNQGFPVNVLTVNKIMIDAKGIENGKVVYAIISNFADPYNGGYTAFYEDAVKIFDPVNSRIDYGNGNIVDNTYGMFEPVISSRSGNNKFLMVPNWTFDRVYLFSYDNGDLVDTAFISHSNPQLQSPKHALQVHNGTQIVVSDQISDLVQRFDTAGFYIGFYAPSTGVNTSILDNIRGIRFLANNNLLVTVANGASENTIQQFDTGGVHTGTFVSSGVTSPFDILLRQNDILITNFSGTNRISRFDNTGTFLNSFYTGSQFAGPQQLYRLDNGNILAAAFSTPSGLALLDSAGSFIRLMTGATGLRGIHLLHNGHYMVTNAAGVHEVDSATGSLIRTIVTGANYQYVSLYAPDMFVSTGNNSAYSLNGYELYSNFPNPFNPMTTIKFSIPKASNVNITVYDVNGRTVLTLLNETRASGTYEVNFNGEGLTSGIYFYRLETEAFIDNKKMMLIK